MNASELREKTVDELKAALHTQLEAHFKLRMQHSTGQLGQSHRLGEARANIARIKTVLNQKAGK